MADSDLKRIRRLGRYLGQDRRRLLLTLTLLVPLAFSVAVQPLLIGQAISILRTVAGATNEAVVPFLQPLDSTLALRLIFSALLIAVLLRFALQRVQLSNNQYLGQRLTARIRRDLFSHALELSLRYHDRMPVGKLLTRLTSDVDALAEVFASGAVGVLTDLVTLIVIAVTMLLIEWRWDCCFWFSAACDPGDPLVATALSQGQLPGPRGVVSAQC